VTLLAEKIPHHEQMEEPESSNDSSFTYRSALLKRGNSRSSSGRWRKVNFSPVCFGARNHQFGKFYVPGGTLAAIKLVHLYGYVSCHTVSSSSWSYWGCGSDPVVKGHVNVVVATSARHILFPPNQFIASDRKWSKIPGYNSLSPELVLSVFSHPHKVTSGQELRLWYGEDFADDSEGDNGGRACSDVYALYV